MLENARNVKSVESIDAREVQSDDEDDLSQKHATLKARGEFRKDVTMTVLTVLCMGVFFGICLNKSKVIDPVVIRDQFRFKRFIMLKTFCGAGCASCIACPICYYFFKKNWEFARSKWLGITNLWLTLFGATLLGFGMALGGACPGLVLAQIGSGVENSLFTLLGGLCGAFIFGLVHPYIVKPYCTKEHLPNFLDQLINIPYYVVPVLFACCFLGIGITLDLLFPWKSELNDWERMQLKDCHFMDCVAWHPFAAGIGIGILQIPGTYILGNTIGASSAYTTATSQWLRLCKKKQETFDRFNHFKAQLNTWWQISYVMSALIGGFIATIAVIGVKKWDIDVLNGGYLMLFGARCSQGCTSGHGLSGTALMTIGSFLSVFAMFTGAAIFMLVYDSLAS